MASSPDEENRRAATEKAQEGRRLLNSGDYQGAISACNESLELSPGSVTAELTRAEAYRRLDMTLALEAIRERGQPAAEAISKRRQAETGENL